MSAPFWCILHLHRISDTTGEGWEPQQPREIPAKIQVRLAQESHDIHIYNIQTTSATFVLSSRAAQDECRQLQDGCQNPWRSFSKGQAQLHLPHAGSPVTAKATGKRAEKHFLFCVSVTRTDTKAVTVWKEPHGTRCTAQ